MLNPIIDQIIKEKGFNSEERYNILTYLVSLHYGLKPTFIPEEVKKKTNILKVIERDYSSGTVKWTVPLFVSKEIQQSEDNWEWVTKEYRPLFKELRGDAGGDIKGCINKMKKFFAEYPEIRKDDVIKATKLYLTDFHEGKSSVQYLQRADYFIYKNSSIGGRTTQSRLAQYVELSKEAKEVDHSREQRGLL